MQGCISLHRASWLGLLGLFLAAAPTLAADDVWTVAGQPSGGEIFKVVVDPSSSGTLYAIANSGVFKSTDGGASWGLALSITDGTALDLAVDPLKPAKVYAANNSTGLWESTDAGGTWNKLTGIPNAHVVVVDPVNEDTVYAIANGCDVYKSTDGGATWNSVATGLTGNADAYCTQIAVDAANPLQLYLATQVGSYQTSTGARGGSSLSGLYSSADGGASWTQNLATLAFADVVIDPSNDQNVYAGSYVSNDGGTTWAPSASAPSRFTVIAVDPTNPQVLWGVELADVEGNLWISTDQGTTWSQVSMPQGNAVYNLVYDPSAATTVYASSMAFGVYKSTDGGSTWGDATSGLTGVYPFDMLADSTGAIYMGTEGTGIFKSTDGGMTWVMKDDGLSVEGGSAGIDAQMLVEASTPGTLYETDQNSLYKTTDGGDSWTPLTVTGGTGSINTLAVDPEQAQTVYVGSGGGQIMKSIDGGTTWIALSVSGSSVDAGIASLVVDPTDSKVLYAGGGSQIGLSKSMDGGATWSPASTGLPTKYGVWCIAVDPKTPQNVYACAENFGIYKSTDGGATWSKAGDLADDAFRIVEVDPNDPNVIYAAIPNFGVWVSTDAGVDWTQLSEPSASSAVMRRTEAVATAGSSPKTSASQSVTISAIAVDPRHAGHLYGVADDGQVYTRGINSGATAPGGGSTANGGGAKSDTSSGGGGGTFPLLGSLLLGLAALGRKLLRPGA
jgi:photosystem II stability/assembly factor-like uncharacterized protein